MELKKTIARSLIKAAYKVRGALLDAAEWSPDRSRRAAFGDRYDVEHTEDDAVGQEGRLTTISECRDLMRNSAVTRGVVERVRAIVVGSTGILPEADSGDAGWDAAAEALWRAWGRDPTSTGRGDITDLQGLLAASLLTDGGMGLFLNADGSVTPIEADRLRAGVGAGLDARPYKVDRAGRVTHWCVVDRQTLGDPTPANARWIPARRMLTLFATTRADQVIGLPQLAAIAQTVRDMEELNRYTLRQAKAQAITAAIHTRGASGDSPFKLRNSAASDADAVEADNAKRFERATGMTVIDTDGDYKTLNPGTPSSTYDAFMKTNLRLVAMSVGLPYEFLALYFADGTYSSAKATMTQAREAVAYRQRQLKKVILDPLWAWKVGQWIAAGLLPQPRRMAVRWRDPSFEWMDVKDAVQTDLMEVKAGLRTMGDLAAKRGADYETLLRKRAQEIATLRRIAAETGVSETELSAITLPGAAAPAPTV